MKRLWALPISGFLILVGTIELSHVWESECTTAEFRSIQAPACGVEGYLYALAWIVFGLVVGYLIWNFSPSKIYVKKIDSDDEDTL